MAALKVTKHRHLDCKSAKNVYVQFFFVKLITINTAIHYCDECHAETKWVLKKKYRANKNTIQTVNCSFDNNLNESKSAKKRNYQKENERNNSTEILGAM